MYCDKRPLIMNVSPRHPSTPPPTNAAASTTADVWSRRRLTGALWGDNRSSAGQSSLLPFNIALLGDRLRDRTDDPFALIVASRIRCEAECEAEWFYSGRALTTLLYSGRALTTRAPCHAWSSLAHKDYVRTKTVRKGAGSTFFANLQTVQPEVLEFIIHRSARNLPHYLYVYTGIAFVCRL